MAVDDDFLTRQQAPDDLQGFVCASAPLGVGHTSGGPLARSTARADPDDQAASADQLQTGELLSGENYRPQGRNEYTGADDDSLGGCCRRRQADGDVENGCTYREVVAVPDAVQADVFCMPRPPRADLIAAGPVWSARERPHRWTGHS